MSAQEQEAFNRCQYVCKRKNRKCKMLAGKNKTFCGEHLAFSEEYVQEDSEKRIACPLDPNHSVFEKELNRHLKKCNAREKRLGVFDVKDVNKLSSDVEDNEERIDIESCLVKNLPENEVNELVAHLLKLDTELRLSEPLETVDYEDAYVNEQLSLNYTGAHAHKHLKQISSIVGLMRNEMNINKDERTCFVELGAGRGKLSHWLSLSLDSKLSKYLLVERGAQRYKFDSYHNDTDEGGKFERVRMDIKNLFLSELDLVKSSDKLVLYGKHLCGSATDHTLHCLRRTLKEDDQSKFKGLLLAVCCHHYCDWETFAGRRYFKQLNLTQRQFYMIRNLTSWATCGSRANSEIDVDKKAFKEKVGYMCKNLIDRARMDYLTNTCDEFKLNANLIYYCDQNVTLENRVMLVKTLKTSR